MPVVIFIYDSKRKLQKVEKLTSSTKVDKLKNEKKRARRGKVKD